MALILHIISRSCWATAKAAGFYHADSLNKEGFIHCSTPEQVLSPANALYRGQKELVLLCIDSEQVQAPIVYEDCYDTGHAFPHIYGPLNVDAVVNIVDFPPDEDGSFSLPVGISEQ